MHKKDIFSRNNLFLKKEQKLISQKRHLVDKFCGIN